MLENTQGEVWERFREKGEMRFTPYTLTIASVHIVIKTTYNDRLVAITIDIVTTNILHLGSEVPCHNDAYCFLPTLNSFFKYFVTRLLGLTKEYLKESLQYGNFKVSDD